MTGFSPDLFFAIKIKLNRVGNHGTRELNPMFRHFGQRLGVFAAAVVLPWAAYAAETNGYATVTLYQSIGGVGPITRSALADASFVDFFYEPVGVTGTGSTYEIVTQPAKGVAIDNGNGTFRFYPNSAFASLAPGVEEQVSLGFRETGSGLDYTINLTVTGVAPPVVTPPPPVVGASTDGSFTTVTGDAVATPITTSFRPLASISSAPVFRPAPAAAAPPAAVAAPAADPGAITQDGAPAAQAAPPAPSRFGVGGESARSVLGSSASVAVSGVANQTFGISLPGKTSFVSGASNINIGSFVHDAGPTPTVSGDGRAVFNIGATFIAPGGAATSSIAINNAGATGTAVDTQASTATPAGEATGGAVTPGTAGGPGTGPASGGGNVATPGGATPGTAVATVDSAAIPVVTSSPFINITISYN